MPDINPAKVCHIVVKAREIEAQDPAALEDDGSNAADEGFRGALADDGSDATTEELTAFIDALDEDDRAELIALAWVGRGDFDKDGWDEALQLARSRDDAMTTAAYLLGIPLLPDLLEEGLAAFDLSCADFEREQMEHPPFRAQREERR
jgi:hypothetical protein